MAEGDGGMLCLAGACGLGRGFSGVDCEENFELMLFIHDGLRDDDDLASPLRDSLLARFSRLGLFG